jgi:tRNA(Ile)-lysidine synthetase-like protein
MSFALNLQSRVIKTLTEQLDKLDAHSEPLWLGLSGGADSVALLHLLASSSLHPRLKAFHIDHDLQSRSAEWSRFCEKLCQETDVPYVYAKVNIDAQQRRTLGMEAAARKLRYQTAIKLMGDAGVLLTAHHADDQLETILMRLERGADLVGSAAIKKGLSSLNSPWGVKQIRPLLTVSKDELIAYLEQRGQAWVEDPSNQDVRIKRNAYRLNVIPQLPESLSKKLLDASEAAAFAIEALDSRFVYASGKSFDWRGAQGNQELARYQLKRWLLANGVGLPAVRLNELLRQLEQGRGRGLAPFYRGATYELWLQGSSLTIR